MEMENTMQAMEVIAEVGTSVLDKAVTRKEVAIVAGTVVGAIVVYKLGKWGYKKLTTPKVVCVPVEQTPAPQPTC